MSREQIDAAKQIADAVRAERAILRARVRPLEHQDGQYEVASILDEGHERALANMPIVGLLKWIKRMQPAHIRVVLGEIDCSEFKLIGELTARQHRLLTNALRSNFASLAKRERGRREDAEIERWAAERNREAAA